MGASYKRSSADGEGGDGETLNAVGSSEDGGGVNQRATAVGVTAAGDGDDVGDVASHGWDSANDLDARLIFLRQWGRGREGERGKRESDE